VGDGRASSGRPGNDEGAAQVGDDLLGFVAELVPGDASGAVALGNEGAVTLAVAVEGAASAVNGGAV